MNCLDLYVLATQLEWVALVRLGCFGTVWWFHFWTFGCVICQMPHPFGDSFFFVCVHAFVILQLYSWWGKGYYVNEQNWHKCVTG